MHMHMQRHSHAKHPCRLTYNLLTCPVISIFISNLTALKQQKNTSPQSTQRRRSYTIKDRASNLVMCVIGFPRVLFCFLCCCFGVGYAITQLEACFTTFFSDSLKAMDILLIFKYFWENTSRAQNLKHYYSLYNYQ